MKDLFAGLKANPGLLGFIWFDYNKSAVAGKTGGCRTIRPR